MSPNVFLHVGDVVIHPFQHNHEALTNAGGALIATLAFCSVITPHSALEYINPLGSIH